VTARAERNSISYFVAFTLCRKALVKDRMQSAAPYTTSYGPTGSRLMTSLVANRQESSNFSKSSIDAAPTVKDPGRVADPSTLRRWFRSLDSSQRRFCSYAGSCSPLSARLGRTETLLHDSLPLRWQTIFPFLAQFWPLRL
jgi:hypothetical protein